MVVLRPSRHGTEWLRRVAKSSTRRVGDIEHWNLLFRARSRGRLGHPRCVVRATSHDNHVCVSGEHFERVLADVFLVFSAHITRY